MVPITERVKEEYQSAGIPVSPYIGEGPLAETQLIPLETFTKIQEGERSTLVQLLISEATTCSADLLLLFNAAPGARVPDCVRQLIERPNQDGAWLRLVTCYFGSSAEAETTDLLS